MNRIRQEQYELPKEQYLEVETQADGSQITSTELKDTEASAPDLLTAPKMDILRYVAKKSMQIDLVDPDPSCGKCYGRGYTAIESATNLPVGCKCIFPNPTNLRRIEKMKQRAERKAAQQNVGAN